MRLRSWQSRTGTGVIFHRFVRARVWPCRHLALRSPVPIFRLSARKDGTNERKGIDEENEVSTRALEDQGRRESDRDRTDNNAFGSGGDLKKDKLARVIDRKKSTTRSDKNRMVRSCVRPRINRTR